MISRSLALMLDFIPSELPRRAVLPGTFAKKRQRAQEENGMETKHHPVNLKQYRKANGKWQFIAIGPRRQTAILTRMGRHAVSSKGGTFCLNYKESGIPRQTAVSHLAGVPPGYIYSGSAVAPGTQGSEC